MRFSLGALVAGIALLGLPPLAGGAATNTTRTLVTPGKPHSFPESYQFDPRDGWESVMVTNLHYKYRRLPVPYPEASPITTPGGNSSSALNRPSKRDTENYTGKKFFRSLSASIAKSMKGIIGMGKPERVVITWYTGQDLLNPSCWSEPTWAPTDQSFVAALTLDGWQGKPQCFDFLELCNTGSSQCTFARVVDSCAGCEKGSKHVDLTRAVFEQLGPLEEGVLTVWMRRASEPAEWDETLWGPRDA